MSKEITMEVHGGMCTLPMNAMADLWEFSNDSPPLPIHPHAQRRSFYEAIT